VVHHRMSLRNRYETMNIPTKKLQSGFELPVYGLGLWEMGGRWEADESKDQAEITAIQSAVALGVTHFDAAESYGDGHAEELLGQAIKGSDRSKLIIATKVSASHQSYEGVHRAFEASLKRLGTDYADLYLLHRYPEPGLPIADTMRAMDELVEQGLVRNIGVCNMTPNRFNEAQKHTKNKLVCNQVHYNVQYREIEKTGILQHCQENDVMLVAWRPLQKGTLLNSPLLAELAKKYNRTPAQVAINWLISQENVVTISKTSNPEHLKDNLGALDWTMEADDAERIRSDFPDQKTVSDAVPLDYEADVRA
jgi:diketogulonate reductase-like aldo/keto reductase